MKLMEKYGDDAMAPLRLCLKVIGAWPEKQSLLQRCISYLNYPVYSVVTMPIVLWYIVVDAPQEGPISLLRGMSDFVGVCTFIVRGTLIFYYAYNVYELSELCTKGCKPYEENHKVVRIIPSGWVWCPNISFFVQLSVSFLVCCSSFWGEVEDRKASVPFPKRALRNDFIFYPVLGAYTMGHLPVWSTVTASDALIISLSSTIREKAETMRNILGDLIKVKDNFQRDIELSKIIIYHNIIATIRNETEKIISYAMLLQLIFLVISLGSPALRLLYDTEGMPLGDLGFSLFYVLWVVTQLLVYCEVCEAATHSCTSIGFAAYCAYEPDMTPAVARKLMCIMARAQRPMNLTARRLIYINRQTLLKICRRSYSLYSAVLNVK